MVKISKILASLLVAEQFPGWSNLSIRPMKNQGNDNRTFRLGDTILMRLPSSEGVF